MSKILKFTSRGCGPCQGLNMALAGVDLGVPVESLDLENDIDAARQYGVRSVPTMILIKDDQEVKRMVGARPLEEIKTWANS
jgi:thioredoxin 1